MSEESGWHAVGVARAGRDQGGPPSGALESGDAEDLATLLVRTWKLSVEQTADILMPVISALAAAHDVGTVHGDLSPRSIRLSQWQHDVVPRVVGFGSSKALEESVQLTGLQAPLGVRMYLSPEQANGAREADARSDQFALGAVLYECLAGQAPFEAESIHAVTAQVVDCRYTRPREIQPSIPRALEAIIARALRKRPDDRFASMRELGAALLPFASRRVQLSYVGEFGPRVTSQRRGSRRSAPTSDGADRVVSTSSGAAEPVSQKASTRRRRVLGVLAAALIVAVLLVLAARQGEETSAGARPPISTPESPSAPAPVTRDEVSERPARPNGAEPSTRAARAERAAPASAPSTYQIDLTVEPSTAWIMLDRKAAGSGRLRRALPIDGRAHELRVGAPGYEARTVRFEDAPPPESLVLEKRAKRPARAPLRPARGERTKPRDTKP